MTRNKGLSFYKKKKKLSARVIHEIFSYIFGIAAAVFIAGVLVYTVGISTSVIGVSMEPSLYNGQKIFINRLAYILTTPSVGDVIVFLPNGNENSHYYVKRVVATAGDRVEIRRSDRSTQLVRLADRSFYQVINQKLGGLSQ